MSVAARPARGSGGMNAGIGTLDWELLVLGALTVAAFALRASQIRQSLVGDEVFTYLDIHGHSLGTVLSTVHTGSENSPPLFFVLSWLCAKVGDPTVLLRLPSLILGTATVPLIYLIGRDAVSRQGALIGSAVFALAPFAVFYGVEARPYATMTFFVALSMLALLRALETRSPAWWLLYALAATAAAYSHYTSIFVLAVQGLWSLWRSRGRLRLALLANALALVLYLPWLPHLRGKALAVIGNLYPLGADRVLTDLLRPIPGHPSASLSAIPTIAGLVAIAACLLLGAAAIVRASEPLVAPRLPLLLALAAATPVGLLIYSLTVTDLWVPRGLSAALPAASLVLGALLAALSRPLLLIGVTIVLGVLTAGTLRSFDATYARPPFRAIAMRLDRIASPSDPILLASLAAQPAISIEFARPHRVVSSFPELWRSVGPGATGYIALDETLGRALKLGVPHHPGLRIVSRHRYVGGGFATELLAYRRGTG